MQHRHDRTHRLLNGFRRHHAARVSPGRMTPGCSTTQLLRPRRGSAPAPVTPDLLSRRITSPHGTTDVRQLANNVPPPTTPVATPSSPAAGPDATATTLKSPHSTTWCGSRSPTGCSTTSCTKPTTRAGPNSPTRRTPHTTPSPRQPAPPPPSTVPNGCGGSPPVSATPWREATRCCAIESSSYSTPVCTSPAGTPARPAPATVGCQTPAY